MLVDIQAPAMAIIIGAWENHINNKSLQCLQNIVDVIDSNPALHTVILSGNHVDLDERNQGKNNWWSNTQEIFLDHQGVDWIRRYWQHPKPKTFATVSNLIKNHAWNNKFCLSIWEQWQLEYLLNHVYPDIQNVWYFGIGLGVRRDPIGWGHLSDSIRCNHVRDVNILTKQDCLLHNTMDNPDFVKTTFTNPDFSGTDWCLVKGDVYAKTTRNWNPETPNGF